MGDSDKEDLEQLQFTPQDIVDLIYDTLEWAERHGGLIPWDNDADLCILANDEERLVALADIFSHYGFTLDKQPFGQLTLCGLSSEDAKRHLDENYGKDWPYVAWRDYDHYYYKGVSNACIKLHDQNERRSVQHSKVQQQLNCP